VANTGAGGGQGGGNSVALLSLRGLGSARTLVLINGRRSAPAGGSSAVDIAGIPISAIERVEVLKDGASAVYGSDAVAGVVNFILRRDFSGTEVSATLGTPTRSGGGKEAKVSVLSGFGSDTYGVTLSASYQKVKPIFGSDRSFARNINVENQLDKTSTTSFPANIRLPNGQLRSANYPDCGPYSIVSPLSPNLCRYDNAPYIALQPDIEQLSAGASGHFAFSPAAEAYAEFNLTRNETNNTTQHVLLNGAALPAGHPYIASLTNLINTQYAGLPAAQLTQLRSLIGSAWAFLPPSSPYYPAAFAAANGLTGQPLVLVFRSVPSGVRKTQDITDNRRLVAGLRGLLMGWDYDGALLYSQNKITSNLTQGWALTDKYLNLVNTGVINPFGATTDPAALQAAMDANYNGLFNVNKTSVTSVDLKASRELMKLSGGPLSVALGVEMRKEKLDIAPSDANRRFLVSGFGAPGVPVSADRKVASAFAEFNIPLLKNLELNTALRWDKYQGVGDTTNPKVSLRWQPVDTLLLRASVGKGFRAPTLLDLYQPEARGITTNGSRDLIRCPQGTTGLIDCSTQFVTIGGGNPNLKPEKSTSASVGFLFEPIKDFSAGLDFFNVEIKDIIRTGLSSATILGDPVRYASYIRRGPPDGNASGVGPITGIDLSLTNLGRTTVAGYDMDLKARVPAFGEQKLTLRFAGTYFSAYKQQNLDGSFTDAVNQPAAIGIGVVLRWRHIASATWDSGPWSATLAENYQNRYQDLRTSLQPTSVTPRLVKHYETFDLQGSYSGFKSIKLAAGIKNLFDKDPPYTNYGAGFVGSYDLSYTDVRGRYAYVSGSYMF
jgi:iron complex outermembrane recepter protein